MQPVSRARTMSDDDDVDDDGNNNNHKENKENKEKTRVNRSKTRPTTTLFATLPSVPLHATHHRYSAAPLAPKTSRPP